MTRKENYGRLLEFGTCHRRPPIWVSVSDEPETQICFSQACVIPKSHNQHNPEKLAKEKDSKAGNE